MESRTDALDVDFFNFDGNVRDPLFSKTAASGNDTCLSTPDPVEDTNRSRGPLWSYVPETVQDQEPTSQQQHGYHTGYIDHEAIAAQSAAIDADVCDPVYKDKRARNNKAVTECRKRQREAYLGMIERVKVLEDELQAKDDRVAILEDQLKAFDPTTLPSQDVSAITSGFSAHKGTSDACDTQDSRKRGANEAFGEFIAHKLNALPSNEQAALQESILKMIHKSQ